MLQWCRFHWDAQEFALVASDRGIVRLCFHGHPDEGAEENPSHPHLQNLTQQLNAYFARQLQTFSLPLAPQGTPFQLRVWDALANIPYAQTRSYRQIAEAIGNPKAVRAVGAANGANPLPIVIPCHRVIGSSGKLTGFGGGLPLKRYLLDLELGHQGNGLPM